MRRRKCQRSCQKKKKVGGKGDGKPSKKAVSPCESYLTKWSIRLDNCCGVGVLKEAVKSGLVKLRLNGHPCYPYKCMVKSDGVNGDYIAVYESAGMHPSVLTITLPGEVELTQGGSVCAQGKYACACKPMKTPDVCGLPTKSPTLTPTKKPSRSPSRRPTWKPTNKPTKKPTYKPRTRKPTRKPTARSKKGDSKPDGGKKSKKNDKAGGKSEGKGKKSNKKHW